MRTNYSFCPLNQQFITSPDTICQQGKCAKMMPVMIWGILILAKKYGVKDFVLAILITLGCTLFLITGEVKSKTAKDAWDSSIYGLLLMLGYLGFDGFTSTFQDRLFKGYQMTTYNQILYTTLCSSVLSLFGALSSVAGAVIFMPNSASLYIWHG